MPQQEILEKKVYVYVYTFFSPGITEGLDRVDNRIGERTINSQSLRTLMYSMIRHCTKQVPAFGESRCRNCAYGQGYLGRNEKYLGMGLRWRFDDVEVEGMIEHRN